MYNHILFLVQFKCVYRLKNSSKTVHATNELGIVSTCVMMLNFMFSFEWLIFVFPGNRSKYKDETN